MGKVVRIDRDGSVPADNPFVGTRTASVPRSGATATAIPQGAALDPATGLLWTVEHGAKGGDEVNQPAAGVNHGWPVITYGKDYSGDPIGIGTEAEGMTQPKYYWDPSIAPSGLAFGIGGLYSPPGPAISSSAPSRDGPLCASIVTASGAIVGEERLFEKALGRIRDVRTRLRTARFGS